MVHDRSSLRGVHHSRMKPEQSPRRYHKFHVNKIGRSALGIDTQDFTPSIAQNAHYSALAIYGTVDCEQLYRLILDSIYNFYNYVGFPDAQLVAFAAHVFKQDSEVHQASA